MKLLGFAVCASIAVFAVPSFAAPADKSETDHSAKQDAKAPEPKRELYTGRVVFLLDALKRRGVKAYDEHEGDVVLETPEGKLIPILSNWRGRAFYQDKRLRNRKVELIAYRRPDLPYLQVISIYVFDKEGHRMYMDYWCDICSIPMYEIKPCDCCQGPIDIRFQRRKLPDYLDLPDEEKETK
jgi:hypothetical protein